MKSFIVLNGDPGRTTDPFGVVALEGTYPNKQIFVRLAKQFKRKSYKRVAKYFTKISKQIHPNLIQIEKNFDYEQVQLAFVHLPVVYVTMSSTLATKTRQKGFSIDKSWCIRQIDSLQKKHVILYPERISYDMQELINQRHEMDAITTATGHVSYKRTRSRHDDLFMAELMGVNAILLWWERLDMNAI